MEVFIILGIIIYLAYQRQDIKRYKRAVNVQLADIHMRVCNKQDKPRNVAKGYSDGKE
jgi:hypothetical protein